MLFRGAQRCFKLIGQEHAERVSPWFRKDNGLMTVPRKRVVTGAVVSEGAPFTGRFGNVETRAESWRLIALQGVNNVNGFFLLCVKIGGKT